MTRASVAFAAFLVLFSGSALAQSSFLRKGQYGIGLSGAYATNSGASGFTGTAGVGLGGLFDLTATAGRARYDSPDFADLEGTTLAPELRAHVVKQGSSQSPVSVFLAAGYARDNFSSPDLDAAGLKMWATSLSIGGGVYRDIRISAKTAIQPTAGLGYASTSFKFRDPLTGITLESTDGIVSFTLGAPFVYGFSDRTLVVVQPGLALNKDTTTFSISAGLIVLFN